MMQPTRAGSSHRYGTQGPGKGAKSRLILVSTAFAF